MKKVAAWAMAGMMATAAWGAAEAEWEHVGRIVGSDGNPLTGEQTLEIRLYNATGNGDVPVWGRQAKAVLDEEGNYSLRLSDALEPLDGSPTNSLESVLAAGPVSVEAKAKGEGEGMVPRAVVAATPYALFAAAAEGAEADFDVAKELTVDGKTVAAAFRAENAAVEGGVDVAGSLTVGGDLAADGGLSEDVYARIGEVPVGTVILFCGEDVPPHWALCDGNTTSNGIRTPDLRGFFAVGAGGSYKTGDEGGDDRVALAPEHLPAHTHGYRRADNMSGSVIDEQDSSLEHASASATTNTFGADASAVAQGLEHENLPPFMALDYIMRVE